MRVAKRTQRPYKNQERQMARFSTFHRTPSPSGRPPAIVEIIHKHGDQVKTEQLGRGRMRAQVLGVLGSDPVARGPHMTASISSPEGGRDRVELRQDASSHATRRTRAPDDTLVIPDFASLQTWRRQVRTVTLTSNLPAILFELPEFSSEQNRIYSALVNDYQKACGCKSGGFFMSAAVVAIVISYFASGGRLSDINLMHVVSFVGITVLATVFGKVLGLLWARWQLLRLATNIYDAVVRPAQQVSL